jgi:hypothetical protein
MGFRRPEEIRRHLSAQSASGLSIAAYCNKIGIHQNTFYYWRKRYNNTACAVVAVPFARLQVSSPVQPQGFEVVFDNRTLLRIPPRFEAESLRTLVDALR